MSDIQPVTDPATKLADLFNDLTTVNEAAKALRKSRSTVLRMVAEGKLPCIWVGRTPYIVVSRARAALMAA
jgi:excisionase family DNA binding protein